MGRVYTKHILFAFVLSIGTVYGQSISNYQLTKNGYEGTMTNMNSIGIQVLIGGDKSETSSAVTPIGFNFIFMGKVYNTFSVNTNGVLRFGDEQIIETANTYSIPANDRIVPLAGVSVEAKLWFWWIPYATLLKTNSTGKVHYKVTGIAPNRVLTVEWLNVGFAEGFSSSNGSFQVRLYESGVSSGQSGTIEFIYDAFTMSSSYRNFSFRTGLGIGPENGNYIAVDHVTRSLTATPDYQSGPVSGSGNKNEISYFNFSGNNRKLIYQFVSYRKPVGEVNNFEVICPSPNSITIKFDENCPDEAGIAVYSKEINQLDSQYKFLASLPADATTVTDTNVVAGQRYVYRFYLLGEGKHSDSYYEYTSDTVEIGSAYQAVASGDWNSTATWGGRKPSADADAELGCARTVYLSISGNESIKNLTIQQGSFLTIENGATLNVSGEFVNNGVFNPMGTGRLILNGSNAQTVTNNGQGITNDTQFSASGTMPTWNGSQTGVVAEKTIQVTDTTFSAIKSVSVDITHTYLRNISVYLVAPNGEVFTLANSRGQAGQNYTNVEFIGTGNPLPPTTKNVNLTGQYRPEQSFASYSGSFAGDWKLRVVNNFTGVGGQFNAFSVTLSKGTSNDLVLRNLTINNTSPAGITLNSGLRVQGSLQLTNGIVHTTTDQAIMVETGAQINAGSGLSFIDGPMYKKGNTNFTFPIGKNSQYAPVSLENIAGGNGVVFMAEYFDNGFGNFDQKDPDVNDISNQEYWEIEPVAGNPTVDIVFDLGNSLTSNLLSLLSTSDLMIVHYTQNKWINEGGLLNILNLLNLSGNMRVNNISSFSPFTYGAQGTSTLPVTFISFEGSNQRQDVVLNWATGSEFNNDYFEIQRSANAKDWQIMGTVHGKGTTNTTSKYQFSDKGVRNGNFYYRLKQVDFDGQFAFSSIIRVNVLHAEELFTAFPNPATSQLTVRNSQYPATVELINQIGIRVLQQEMHEFQTTLLLDDLQEGIYLVRLTHEGKSQVQKIFITH